jgi:hypothetical protein
LLRESEADILACHKLEIEKEYDKTLMLLLELNRIFFSSKLPKERTQRKNVGKKRMKL